MSSPNNLYRISNAYWEDPRCYWRSHGVDKIIKLSFVPSESVLPQFEWMLVKAKGSTFNIRCGSLYVKVDGNKLMLGKLKSEAAYFHINEVGAYVVISYRLDDQTYLVECEDGNLGETTDIQLWAGKVPTTVGTDVSAIPTSILRYLWKLDTASLNHANWMQKIADERLLSELLLCGTHDTCTYKINVAAAAAAGAATGAVGGSILPFFGTAFGALAGVFTGATIAKSAVTQWHDVSHQLEAGIRVFDLRVGASLNIYHGGIPTGISFKSVLDTFAHFLQGPSENETIIIQVKREAGGMVSATDEGYWTRLNHIIDNESPNIHWYLENRIPRMQDVRGKVVLIRRYIDQSNAPRGIDFTALNDNQHPKIHVGNVLVEIQDEYQPGDSAKKKVEIQRLLPSMKTHKPLFWYINFTSAAGGMPSSYAADINPWLGTLLNFESHMQGVFMMDFPSPELVDRIIRLNDFSPVNGPGPVIAPHMT